MKKIRRFTIRSKVLLLDVLLFGVCFMTLIFSNYLHTAAALRSQMENTVQDTLHLMTTNLTAMLGEGEYVSNSLALSSQLSMQLTRCAKQDDRDQVNTFFEIKPRFTDLEGCYTHIRIKLYLPEGIIFRQEQIHFFPDDLIKDASWYAAVQEANGRLYWTRDEINGAIIAARVWKNIGQGNEVIGMLVVEMKDAAVLGPLSGESHLSEKSAYLLDAGGRYLGGAPAPDVKELIRLAQKPDGIPFEDSVEGKRCVAVGEKIPMTGWQVLMTVPYDAMVAGTRQLRNVSILLSLGVLLLSILLSVFSLNHITHRVKMLSGYMRKAEENHFSWRIDIRYRDEFAPIEEQYNSMCDRIVRLIDQVYLVEAKKKEAELRTLQAQINPHFLYNALDTINWMAVERGADEISEITVALGRFARLSLSRGRDVVPLRREIEITMLYLQVQKARFDDYLQMNCQVDTEVLDCACIKLLLQPIVENAIKHGFQREEMSCGTISIIGCRREDRVHIEIRDNGRGLDGTYDLRRQPDRLPGNGFGLFNICERLQLYYPDNFEFLLAGQPGKGTVVTLEWPMMPPDGPPDKLS